MCMWQLFIISNTIKWLLSFLYIVECLLLSAILSDWKYFDKTSFGEKSKTTTLLYDYVTYLLTDLTDLNRIAALSNYISLLESITSFFDSFRHSTISDYFNLVTLMFRHSSSTTHSINLILLVVLNYLCLYFNSRIIFSKALCLLFLRSMYRSPRTSLSMAIKLIKKTLAQMASYIFKLILFYSIACYIYIILFWNF